jgi:hypothetical protein
LNIWRAKFLKDKNMNDDLMYLAMARGIFMGLSDMGDMDALFPEVNSNWVDAVNDAEKVKKLAEILKQNNSKQA